MKNNPPNPLIQIFFLFSIPIIIIGYFYEASVIYIYCGAFMLGMIFQADQTIWDFLKILYKGIKRDICYWNCRLRKHRLTLKDMRLITTQPAIWGYCDKCKFIIKIKSIAPTGIYCRFCKKIHDDPKLCKEYIEYLTTLEKRKFSDQFCDYHSLVHGAIRNFRREKNE